MEPPDNYPHQLGSESSLEYFTALQCGPRSADIESCQLGTESSSEYFPAHNSAPRPPESETSLLRRFDGYKLETEFGNGFVVHKTCTWERLGSSRTWVESKWTRKEKVGAGAFGQVWVQERERKGKGASGTELRAVKKINRDLLPAAGRSQELLALVKLDEYDHVFVKFLGWYENPHSIFLVMEYIELGDLKSCESTWTTVDVKEIMRQLLEGLVILHSKSICHRDLKPQNILVACLDPVWIKITDFGISKELIGTFARTRAGTRGYSAPEIDGLVPREFRKGFVPHALDIWSLGSLLHELLTSEIPFIEHLSDDDLESMLDSESGPIMDSTALYSFCHGLTEFPTNALQRSKVDADGIAFVKRLLTANPKNRPTASCARQDPWLDDTYTSDYVQKLTAEFSLLGIVLDFQHQTKTLMRQAAKVDIMELVPSLGTDTLSLAAAALERGCSLTLSRLFESPNLDLESGDSLARGELFRLAAKSREFGVLRTLFQKGAHIGALVVNRTVPQWAVESGDIKTLDLFLEITNNGCLEFLQLAIESKNLSMLRFILGKNININCTSWDSQLLLQAAVEGGENDIVKLLLDYGADANAARKDGRTLLQAALEGGDIGIAKLLLDFKADINTPRNDGRTLLQAALEDDEIEIAKFLSDNGADIHVRPTCEEEQPALQEAAEGRPSDTADLQLGNTQTLTIPLRRHWGGFGMQNAPGQTQRHHIIDPIPDYTVSVLLLTLVHGHTAPGQDPATLIVTKFQFLSRHRNCHFHKVSIELLFADVVSRGSNIDPEVAAISSHRKFSQFSPTVTAVIKSEERDYGPKNVAEWLIEESRNTPSGIPHSFQSGILLKRNNHDRFHATVKISVEVDGFHRISTSRHSGQSPIYFDPELQPCRLIPEGLDPDCLSSYDLQKLI